MNPKYKNKILIVEDEMIIAADLSLQFSKLGYNVLGIETSGEKALEAIEHERPDVVLMDIILKGEMDGIQASQFIADNYQIPVIFLTSNSDDATFKRAIATKPYAFISKPFQQKELERVMELTFRRLIAEQEELEEEQHVEDHEDLEVEQADHTAIMKNKLFIRHNNELVKIYLKNILFVEANRNYCQIITLETKKYVLSVPMKTIETQLAGNEFVKVHRSFIVNFKQVDSVSSKIDFLKIKEHSIPISRRLKDTVISRFNSLS